MDDVDFKIAIKDFTKNKNMICKDFSYISLLVILLDLVVIAYKQVQFLIIQKNMNPKNFLTSIEIKLLTTR